MNKFPATIFDLARTFTSNTKISRSSSLYRGGITYNRDFQKALIHYLFFFSDFFAYKKPGRLEIEKSAQKSEKIWYK